MSAESIPLECPVSCCQRRYYGARSKDCLREHLWEFSSRCKRHSESYTRLFPAARKDANVRYICDICSRRFARSFAHKRHVQTHDLKRYPCPQCHKKFRQQRNVAEHLSKNRCRARGLECIEDGILSSYSFKITQPIQEIQRATATGGLEDGYSNENMEDVTHSSKTSNSSTIPENGFLEPSATLERIDSVERFDLSTLVEAHEKNTTSEPVPSFDLSSLVQRQVYDPIIASSVELAVMDDNSFFATPAQPFDISNLDPAHSDMPTSIAFDLATLVYPSSEPFPAAQPPAKQFPCDNPFFAGTCDEHMVNRTCADLGSS
ncbi:uncharacterized protein BO97DRAFT_407772 [Aspergillus homomorphus CBS 101889]|uniref:C2H2-type domain-containing protein n=1 Tax=Aspergillus homomorphus (strain CBS 101889) TaxID=1450537 RepID=A0A395HNQ8_ASPHC|nr:hypothetical protein BO97DRAFT_407772 [Aspergillus homomorphus CBS 101889]RAL09457.1 hypothetical protein BO97DRAFT_407772 [Aspergillus homomorphus CBS 101889]